MFDWANSAFTTLVVTFIHSTYFTKFIARDAVTGTVLWSRAIASSALLIALLSPIMEVLADRGGKRRQYLGVTVAVSASAALAFVSPTWITRS